MLHSKDIMILSRSSSRLLQYPSEVGGADGVVGEEGGGVLGS